MEKIYTIPDLEWVEHEKEFIANTPYEQFVVVNSLTLPFWFKRSGLFKGAPEYFKTFEEAKQAANNHWKELISKCLKEHNQ